jgi:hypothetical protein
VDSDLGSVSAHDVCWRGWVGLFGGGSGRVGGSS